ncbi:MATE family efflux transporter [Moheibacter lacus]|uniref:Multidrug-efflux transporter n=1 Tax=Moheibacter lacus TaxID=2745851 RepID=A0A838ZP65_9FLAO|nr:MATE family efflux transporter [Moheibacter lacus]MBA5629566.1 MATE family efflux transporter [Moheibacter lacus]
MSSIYQKEKFTHYFKLILQSLKGEAEFDYTKGNLNKAVILLAIPMMLEMVLESVFALVDLYLVGHLENSSFAVQTVGLTESVLTIIYSLCIGLSMAVTAIVARRIGEKNPEAAAKAGAQTLLISFCINLLLSILGVIYAKEILLLMGSSEASAEYGKTFVQIMMGGSISIVLLFLINGIFRGTGNAAIAMKSLWIANLCNIILAPIFVMGIGNFEGWGLTGAAIATTTGRSIGVIYQCYHLFFNSKSLQIKLHQFLPDWEQIRSIIKIAAPAVMQFVIASCSWIVLAKLVAESGGDEASAGYQTALRIMMFFMLPAWGLSNAAATLVGQNMGANQLERATKSVFLTARFNVVYMSIIMILTFLFAGNIMPYFTNDLEVVQVAKQAIFIMSCGYVFYGIGMVMVNAFNGSGDTWTPTWINLFGFWFLQIPLAYVLAQYFDLDEMGVFLAIPIAETAISIAGIILFRKGKWKKVKV